MNQIMGIIVISANALAVFGLIVNIISYCRNTSHERADKIWLACLFAALVLLCIGLCIITVSMAHTVRLSGAKCI